MKRCLVMLVVLLAVSVTAQAAIVPAGDFQMYKPGTSYTVTAELDGGGVNSAFGDNLTVIWGGSAVYGDGTVGTTVDLPGWTLLVGGVDVDARGYGGSNAMSTFGTGWGGPSRAETTGDLGAVGADLITISAMVGNSGGYAADGPITFYLNAGGVEVAGGALVQGAADVDGFREISRTYSAAALSAYLGDAISIVAGTPDDNGTGGRTHFSNVSMVPEPATMALLALGGLALRRRRKA